MENRKPFTKLIGTIFGIGLLIALGFVMSGWFRAMRTARESAPASSQSQPASPSQEKNQEKASSPSTTSESSGQVDPTADWEMYENGRYSFTLKYPPSLTIEELSPEDRKKFGLTGTFAVRFYSPEAAPDALIPSGQEAAGRFEERYVSGYLQVHDNPLNLSLEDALQRIYFEPSIDPQKTVFELMRPDLRPYRDGPPGALIFVGSLVETPRKSIYFLHRGRVYEVTLSGGAGGTGAMYSATAERVFGLMVSTLKLQ